MNEVQCGTGTEWRGLIGQQEAPNGLALECCMYCSDGAGIKVQAREDFDPVASSAECTGADRKWSQRGTKFT